MSPPPVADATVDISTEITREDLQHIKWAGWTIAGVVLLGWAGWISLLAIANASETAVIEERQNSQYEQLREDIAEVKELLRSR